MPATRIPWIAALLTFAVHLVANPHYGFFRDELYFIICGRHPQWGYVDQPPVVPLIAAGTQLFGHSLMALRASAAVCGAAAVYVACILIARLGGGRFAQMLGAICVALAPVLTALSQYVGPDMIGLWAWPLAALFVLYAIERDARWWLAAGAALGLAGEAKYSVLFFGVALLVGMLLSPQRRALFTPWFVGGIAVAAIIVAPNIVWQGLHGWPIIELLRNGQQGKNVILSPFDFLARQLLLFSLPIAVVVVCGIVYGFLRERMRWMAWAFVVLIAMMIATRAKDYYPADAFSLMIVTGSIAIEDWTARVRIVRPIAVAIVVLVALVFVPFTMPVLPEEQFIAYEKILHVNPAASSNENHRFSALPQQYADMHGWPQLAARVADVYRRVPERDRANSLIAASNYGEAAAIEFFNDGRDLAPVVSGHNQYFLWGTHGRSGDVVIDVNGDCGAKQHLFAHSSKAATFSAPYVMPYEDRVPIMLCRGITKPIARIWPGSKFYI